MALDLSKLNFFSRLDARARVVVLFAGVIGVLVLIYVGTAWFAGGSSTVGPSKVASAPQSLQSIPGAQLTPEYYRALSQADVKAAEQAKITGSSAIPTLINTGEPKGGAAQCNIICSDQSANVRSLLTDWAKQGKISPELVDQLDQASKKAGSPEAFAGILNDLVKNNKLTPEQARELLEQFKKQHANALLQDSAGSMDGMIKSGALSLSAANELLTAQKQGVSASDYAGKLQQMVKEDKISSPTSQQLLAQYTQQRAKEVTMQSIAILQDWARQGQIVGDVANQLIDLENQMVSMSTFESKVKAIVSQGRIAPVVADKVIEEYKQQKAAIGPTSAVNAMVTNAEAPAYQELNDLQTAGKITQETAQQLGAMIKSDISLEDYVSTIGKMVTEKKLTPDIAKLKIADYQAVKSAREIAALLASLQQNNGTNAQYADALKQAVTAGLITPDQAADLMRQYQAITTKAIAPVSSGGETSEFAELQKQVQKGASTSRVVTANQFIAAPTQGQGSPEANQERIARMQSLVTAMAGQAQQLVSAWQPPAMDHKERVETKKNSADTAGSAGATSSENGSLSATSAATLPVLIKSGTVIFAVLDTAVNSDYPDSPVMATIVEGKYKGAKLLGKLTTTKSVSGQLDRVSLNFQLMNVDEWPQSKSVTAFAIDPDTARTVLASNVNYHYMMRFGAIMATSFVQGYAGAVSSSGATTGVGLNGTQTASNSVYSPTDKITMALGQIGQTLGSVTQNYVNRPPTVKVDSGVSLGILFMADVT